MSTVGVIQSLNIYPLKSCAGQAVKEMNITFEGPEGDRQWMLVDNAGQFLTPETAPKMATLQVMVNEQGLNLALGKQFFVVPAKSSFKRLIRVKIQNEEIELALEADLFSQALSQFLDVNCRLVRVTPTTPRFDLWKNILGPSQAHRANIIYSNTNIIEAAQGTHVRIGEVTFVNSGALWVPQNTGRIALGQPVEVLT